MNVNLGLKFYSLLLNRSLTDIFLIRFSRAFLRACSIVLAGKLPRIARIFYPPTILAIQKDFDPLAVTFNINSGTLVSQNSTLPFSGNSILLSVTIVKSNPLLIKPPILSGVFFWEGLGGGGFSGVFRSVLVDF
jgi:hypothetical protein